jgi:hypothetical protein
MVLLMDPGDQRYAAPALKGTEVKAFVARDDAERSFHLALPDDAIQRNAAERW